MSRTLTAPSVHRVRCGFAALLVAVTIAGCGATRENAGIGSAQAKNDASPALTAPPAESPGSPAAEGRDTSAREHSLEERSTAKGETESSPSPSKQAPAREESVPKSGAGAAPAPRAKAARARQERSPLADDDEGARPAFAEPSELQRALAEFESQLTTLSTTKSCVDACKALESMRRSAQQICTLVLEDDPRRRCPTAKERLEQATRDLAARCPSCG